METAFFAVATRDASRIAGREFLVRIIDFNPQIAQSPGGTTGKPVKVFFTPRPIQIEAEYASLRFRVL